MAIRFNLSSILAAVIVLAAFPFRPVFATDLGTTVGQGVEILFPSPKLAGIRLPLPLGFAESSKIAFPAGANIPKSFSVYCLPDDAALMAEQMQGKKIMEPHRVGCVSVVHDSAAHREPVINDFSGRFSAQDYADWISMAPAPATKGSRLPAPRVFGMDRREVRGIPVISFSEEWSGPTEITVWHHLIIFNDKDVWTVIYTTGTDKAAVDALWSRASSVKATSDALWNPLRSALELGSSNIPLQGTLPMTAIANGLAAPKSAATDALGVAMDDARNELASKKSWAKDAPPVIEARRKGGTLLIRIAAQDVANTDWKSWWELTICEALELKKILLLDGGVLVYDGNEPKFDHQPGILNGVFFNKGDCYARVRGWNSK